MFEWIASPEAWIALATLTALEISGRDIILIVVGLTLLLEGLDVHVPKGYIYFAMLFSLSVEVLNIRMRKRSDPLKLHKKYE